jgi:hypothetical protein
MMALAGVLDHHHQGQITEVHLDFEVMLLDLEEGMQGVQQRLTFYQTEEEVGMDRITAIQFRILPKSELSWTLEILLMAVKIPRLLGSIAGIMTIAHLQALIQRLPVLSIDLLMDLKKRRK